ncbi:hypothetical protein LP581_24210, partial [Escherichia coli]|uniref:hypothetical protein n=1 Tax=Escherichia coli TaxID=562 RepID=UPI0020413C9B
PSISDGRLSYQFSSDGYIRRSVYAYEKFNLILKYLISGMSEIGKELESYWENDRYVRSIPEEFIE